MSHNDAMMTSSSIFIEREFNSLSNGVGFGCVGGPYTILYPTYANFRVRPPTQILTFFKKFLHHSIENQILYRMV